MLKKLISIVTLSCFLFSFVLSQSVQAALELRNNSTEFKKILDDFIIPSTIGRITEAKYFGSDDIVINIQDLHCHAEVQRNISRILSILDGKYKLSRVFVEGAYGSVDTSWLAYIKDNELKKNLVETLVDQGKLTGTEHYSITSNRPDLLYGLEDEKLYRENFFRLNTILGKKGKFELYVTLLKKDLQTIQNRYFNADNKNFERIIKKHKDRQVDAEKYYRLLKKFAEKLNRKPYDFKRISNVDISSYENINGYLGLIAQGRKLKYKNIAKQLQGFVSELKQKLSYNAYNFLLEKTDNFSKLDELYIYLTKIVKGYELNIKGDYPQLNEFFEYIDNGQKINPLELIREEKKLVEEIRTGFSRDASELEVGFLADFFTYFEDFLNNRLSADDYEYFAQRFEEFRLLWAKYADTNRLVHLEEDFSLLNDFYRVNLERNKSFINNIFPKRDGLSFPKAVIGDPDSVDNKMDSRFRGNDNTKEIPPETDFIPFDENRAKTIESLDNAKQVIVVVTGGFHTKGIETMLSDKKISYLAITPNVTRDTKSSDTAYRKLALEQAKIFAQASESLIQSQFNPPSSIPLRERKKVSDSRGGFIRPSFSDVMPEIRTDCVANVVADSSAILDNIFTEGLPINGQLQRTLKCGKRAVVTHPDNRVSIIFSSLARNVISKDSLALYLLSKYGPEAKLGNIIEAELNQLEPELLKLLSDAESEETVGQYAQKKLDAVIKNSKDTEKIFENISKAWNDNDYLKREGGELSFKGIVKLDQSNALSFIFILTKNEKQEARIYKYDGTTVTLTSVEKQEEGTKSPIEPAKPQAVSSLGSVIAGAISLGVGAGLLTLVFPPLVPVVSLGYVAIGAGATSLFSAEAVRLFITPVVKLWQHRGEEPDKEQIESRTETFSKIAEEIDSNIALVDTDSLEDGTPYKNTEIMAADREAKILYFNPRAIAILDEATLKAIFRFHEMVHFGKYQLNTTSYFGKLINELPAYVNFALRASLFSISSFLSGISVFIFSLRKKLPVETASEKDIERPVGTDEKIASDGNDNEAIRELVNSFSNPENKSKIESMLYDITNRKIRKEDLQPNIDIEFYAKGSNKRVYKVTFYTEDGLTINIAVAVKIEKELGKIQKKEIEDLKWLSTKRRRGLDLTPKLGFSYETSTGKEMYVEEFIEGLNAEDCEKQAKLTVPLKKKILCTLFSIGIMLGNNYPKDAHAANFIVKNDNSAVMVDIGNKRFQMSPENKSLNSLMEFMFRLFLHYGEPIGNEFIINSLNDSAKNVEDYLRANKIGTLRAHKTIESAKEDIADYLERLHDYALTMNDDQKTSFKKAIKSNSFVHAYFKRNSMDEQTQDRFIEEMLDRIRVAFEGALGPRAPLANIGDGVNLSTLGDKIKREDIIEEFRSEYYNKLRESNRFKDQWRTGDDEKLDKAIRALSSLVPSITAKEIYDILNLINSEEKFRKEGYIATACFEIIMVIAINKLKEKEEGKLSAEELDLSTINDKFREWILSARFNDMVTAYRRKVLESEMPIRSPKEPTLAEMEEIIKKNYEEFNANYLNAILKTNRFQDWREEAGKKQLYSTIRALSFLSPSITAYKINQILNLINNDNRFKKYRPPEVCLEIIRGITIKKLVEKAQNKLPKEELDLENIIDSFNLWIGLADLNEMLDLSRVTLEEIVPLLARPIQPEINKLDQAQPASVFASMLLPVSEMKWLKNYPKLQKIIKTISNPLYGAPVWETGLLYGLFTAFGVWGAAGILTGAHVIIKWFVRAKELKDEQKVKVEQNPEVEKELGNLEALWLALRDSKFQSWAKSDALLFFVSLAFLSPFLPIFGTTLQSIFALIFGTTNANVIAPLINTIPGQAILGGIASASIHFVYNKLKSKDILPEWMPLASIWGRANKFYGKAVSIIDYLTLGREISEHNLFEQIRQIDESNQKEYDEELLKLSLKNKENICLLAKDSKSEQIIGYLIMYPDGKIVSFQILKDLQNISIGLNMFEAAAIEARKRKLNKVSVDFEPNNQRNKFYQNKLGQKYPAKFVKIDNPYLPVPMVNATYDISRVSVSPLSRIIGFIGKLYDSSGKLVVNSKDIEVRKDEETGKIQIRKNGKLLHFKDGGIAILDEIREEIPKIDLNALLDIDLDKLDELISGFGTYIREFISAPKIILIEDNKYVRAFRDSEGNLYITKSLLYDKVALFHELGEGFFAEHPRLLPKGVNAHTYLRGCGKDVREAYREISSIYDPEKLNAEELIKAIKSILRKNKKRKMSASEESLIRHNEKNKIKGPLINGLQYQVFGEAGNRLGYTDEDEMVQQAHHPEQSRRIDYSSPIFVGKLGNVIDTVKSYFYPVYQLRDGTKVIQKYKSKMLDFVSVSRVFNSLSAYVMAGSLGFNEINRDQIYLGNFGFVSVLEEYFGEPIEVSINNSYKLAQVLNFITYEPKNLKNYEIFADKLGKDFVNGDIYRLYSNASDSYKPDGTRIGQIDGREVVRWVDNGFSFSDAKPYILDKIREYLKLRYTFILRDGFELFDKIYSLEDKDIEEIAEQVYGGVVREAMIEKAQREGEDVKKLGKLLDEQKKEFIKVAKARRDVFKSVYVWIEENHKEELDAAKGANKKDEVKIKSDSYLNELVTQIKQLPISPELFKKLSNPATVGKTIQDVLVATADVDKLLDVSEKMPELSKKTVYNVSSGDEQEIVDETAGLIEEGVNSLVITLYNDKMAKKGLTKLKRIYVPLTHQDWPELVNVWAGVRKGKNNQNVVVLYLESINNPKIASTKTVDDETNKKRMMLLGFGFREVVKEINGSQKMADKIKEIYSKNDIFKNLDLATQIGFEPSVIAMDIQSIFANPNLSPGNWLYEGMKLDAWARDLSLSGAVFAYRGGFDEIDEVNKLGFEFIDKKEKLYKSFDEQKSKVLNASDLVIEKETDIKSLLSQYHEQAAKKSAESVARRREIIYRILVPQLTSIPYKQDDGVGKLTYINPRLDEIKELGGKNVLLEKIFNENGKIDDRLVDMSTTKIGVGLGEAQLKNVIDYAHLIGLNVHTPFTLNGFSQEQLNASAKEIAYWFNIGIDGSKIDGARIDLSKFTETDVKPVQVWLTNLKKELPQNAVLTVVLNEKTQEQFRETCKSLNIKVIREYIVGEENLTGILARENECIEMHILKDDVVVDAKTLFDLLEKLNRMSAESADIVSIQLDVFEGGPVSEKSKERRKQNERNPRTLQMAKKLMKILNVRVALTPEELFADEKETALNIDDKYVPKKDKDMWVSLKDIMTYLKDKKDLKETELKEFPSKIESLEKAVGDKYPVIVGIIKNLAQKITNPSSGEFRKDYVSQLKGFSEGISEKILVKDNLALNKKTGFVNRAHERLFGSLLLKAELMIDNVLSDDKISDEDLLGAVNILLVLRRYDEAKKLLLEFANRNNANFTQGFYIDGKFETESFINTLKFIKLLSIYYSKKTDAEIVTIATRAKDSVTRNITFADVNMKNTVLKYGAFQFYSELPVSEEDKKVADDLSVGPLIEEFNNGKYPDDIELLGTSIALFFESENAGELIKPLFDNAVEKMDSLAKKNKNKPLSFSELLMILDLYADQKIKTIKEQVKPMFKPSTYIRMFGAA